MRIMCDTELSNRLLPTFNMKQKGKVSKAQLSVGRKPGSKQGAVYLLLCTKQDRSGQHFQLQSNVQQCFTKFVHEGKATIRMCEPPYDLCISKADPVQLKGLLSVVKMAAQGKSLDQITLSSLAPASATQVEKLKTKMTILNRRDYPITKGFPCSLEVLSVQECMLKKIDSRILKLKRLTILTLSHNLIRVLPEDWSSCCCLKELHLSHNEISDIPKPFCTGPLSKSLHTLDLCYNKLSLLRPYFCDLHNLSILRLDHNTLRCLPMQLGGGGGRDEGCSRLRILSASHNQLQTLPASFTRLHLDSLDLFENPFLEHGPSTVRDRLSCPSLLEWAARAIITYKVKYTEEDVGHLIDFLASVKFCLCRAPCFRSHVHFLLPLSLSHVSASVTAGSGSTEAPCEAFLCSRKCLTKYQKNPRASIWR